MICIFILLNNINIICDFVIKILQVIQLKENGDNRITEELLILARPSDPRVFWYSGYILNGSRFQTMESELGLKTQNYGVVVKSDEHT